MIDDDAVQRVREGTDLPALLGQTLELKKAGTNFVACCPFHNEKSPSFTIYPDHFHCFGCKKSGDAIDWLMDRHGLSFQEAVIDLGNRLGISVADHSPAPRRSKPKSSGRAAAARKPDPEPEPEPANVVEMPAFDWQKCRDDFGPDDIKKLAAARGFSVEFVEWLSSAGHVGKFRGGVAFPVHGPKGKVVGCHYQTRHGWAHHPGGHSAAWVIGTPEEATFVCVHESQWDALAQLEAFGHHEDPRELAVIITRGATGKTDMSAFRVPVLTAIPQNDPDEKRDKDGKTPSDRWIDAVSASRAPGTSFRENRVPIEFEDLNAWTRDGHATDEEVRQLTAGAKNPVLKNVVTFAEVSQEIGRKREIRKKDPHAILDPNAMIAPRTRFLCRGGSFILTGTSGIGKSTLMMSMATHFAAGIPWHGIEVRKPLKVLVVQAENDQGDMEDMLEGATNEFARHLDMEQKRALAFNLMMVHETERTGKEWCDWLEEMIKETEADLVFADPLLSYIGDDVSQQKVCSQFLRNWLNPVLRRTGAIIGFVHHTGKVSSDAKARSGWSNSDYSYIGIGSSEITNWARAMLYLSEVKSEKPFRTFKLMITKRGSRARMRSNYHDFSTDHIFLRHTLPYQQWDQTDDPNPEDKKDGVPPSQEQTIEVLIGSLPKEAIPFKEATSILINRRFQSARDARRVITEAVKLKLVAYNKDLETVTRLLE